LKFINLFFIILLVNIKLDAYLLQEPAQIPTNSTSLLNKDTLELLCLDAKWSDSHGSDKKSYLGAGILYYAIVYAKKAKLSVCLGSGGGFVPRIMRQAQRDLNIEGSQTILIDGNLGRYGTPDWLSENSTFRIQFPDIKIIIERTDSAVSMFNKYPKIDYLHIDADHSLKGCTLDFNNYLPYMSKTGIITIHDTGTKSTLACKKIVKKLRGRGFNVVNFYEQGNGFALIQLGD
jgi:hypothetical protein